MPVVRLSAELLTYTHQRRVLVIESEDLSRNQLDPLIRDTFDLALMEIKMDDKNESATQDSGGGFRVFVTSFLASLARDAFKLVIAFAVGTGGGAIFCWYYGIPLGLSILGGILVLGVALALMTDS